MESNGSGKTERAQEAFKKMLHATESVVRLLDDQLCSFDLTTGQFRALEARLGRRHWFVQLAFASHLSPP